MIRQGKLLVDMDPLTQLGRVALVEDAIKQYSKGKFCLMGEDGNAYAIMGRIDRALRKQGWKEKACHEALRRMMAGDYNNLLRVAMDLQDPRYRKIDDARADLQEREQEILDDGEASDVCGTEEKE